MDGGFDFKFVLDLKNDHYIYNILSLLVIAISTL